MKFILLLSTIVIFASCATTTNYYVLRHAEKSAQSAGMSADVPLSQQGAARADALKEKLAGKSFAHLYSTNYQRTKQTAAPLASAKNMTTEIYDPRDTGFVARVHSLPKGNILIVGHSNTVDDLVNGIAGQKFVNGDLPDSAYGDLFIITKKKSRYTFRHERFGN